MSIKLKLSGYLTKAIRLTCLVAVKKTLGTLLQIKPKKAEPVYLLHL